MGSRCKTSTLVCGGHVGGGEINLRRFIDILALRKDGWGAGARCLQKCDGTTVAAIQKWIDANLEGEQREHYTEMLGDVVSLMKRGTASKFTPDLRDWESIGNGAHRRKEHMTI